MSDDMRFRFKERPKQPNTTKREPKQTSESGSIFGVWEEQRRLQAEDEKMAKELAETKKKAKELQKTLRKNRYGEVSKKTNQKTKQTVDSFKTYSKKFYEKVSSLLKQNKKITYAAAGVFVLVVSMAVITGSFNSDESTSTLGESTAQIPIADDLPREKPEFKLIFPNGNKSSDYDVVRISPPEADASFTYLDRFTEDGQIFRVTQQEIPGNFDLAKTATDFQATSIIQVDENVIYHGYSEQGGVQSILFIKDKKLISIRSPQKFSDDQWAGYYLSLK
jgi:hypothetical protein